MYPPVPIVPTPLPTNGISIGSSVFAQLSFIAITQIHKLTVAKSLSVAISSRIYTMQADAAE